MRVPKTGVIVGRNVGRPYSAGGGKQASEEFFRANAQEVSSFLGLAGRPRAGHVTVAPLVPIDKVVTLVHYFHSATQSTAEAHYGRNFEFRAGFVTRSGVLARLGLRMPRQSKGQASTGDNSIFHAR